MAHSQKLAGNFTDLTWDTNIAGMDNRLVTTVAVSGLDFVRPGAANFPHDLVTLVDPARGFYGLLTTQQQTARIDNESAVVRRSPEDHADIRAGRWPAHGAYRARSQFDSM